MYLHYVRLDSDMNVTKAFSSVDGIEVLPSDKVICTDSPDASVKLNIFDRETGCLKYKWDGSKLVEKDLTLEKSIAKANQEWKAKVDRRKHLISKGQEIIATIALANEERGLSTEGTVKFMSDPRVQAIKNYLESGALETAYEVIRDTDFGDLIVEVDKQFIMSLIQQEIPSAPQSLAIDLRETPNETSIWNKVKNFFS